MNHSFTKNTLLTVLVMIVCGSLMSQNNIKDRYIRSEQSKYVGITETFEEKNLDEITDASDLYNFYLAHYFSNYANKSKAANINKRSEILKQLNHTSPISFEASFLNYYSVGYNENGIANLKKAYKIDPNRTETWDDLLGYYEIIGDREKAQEMAHRIKENGKYEKSIYDYCSNVIASTNGPSVIFTQGELDYYPLLVLKYINDLENIVPVSLKLLEYDSYRQSFLNKISSTDVSFKSGNPKSFMEKLDQQHLNYKLYTGLTLKRNYLNALKNNLYLTGLAFQYSSTPLLNVQMCLNNFRKTTFSKDYFFNKRMNNVESNDLHRNYLPFLDILIDQKEQISEEEYAKLNAIKLNITNRLR